MANPHPMVDILRAMAIMIELGLTAQQIHTLVEQRLTNTNLPPRLVHGLRLFLAALREDLDT